MRFANLFCLVVAASLLSGCSGGDGETPAPARAVTIGALKGYYVGTVTPDSGEGQHVVGIVSDTGEGHFLNTSTNDQIVAYLDGGDTAVSGTISMFSASGTSVNVTPNTSVQPPSGPSPHTTLFTSGTLIGDFEERNSIEAAYSTVDGVSGTLSLSYDGHMFEQPAALNLLTGNWSWNGADTDKYGITLTFRTDGSFEGSDTKGCAYNGKAVVPDATVNQYVVAATVACATGTYEATGLALRVPAEKVTDLGAVRATHASLVLAIASETRSFFVTQLERQTP